MTIIYDKRGWPYLNCPEGHCMGWLGSRYWMCSECRPRMIHTIRSWTRTGCWRRWPTSTPRDEGAMSELTVGDLVDLHRRAEKLGLSTAGYALHLEREREADREAIRWLDEQLRIALCTCPYSDRADPDTHATWCSYRVSRSNEHADSIQRAQDAKG